MVKCGEIKSKAYWPVPGSKVGYTTPSGEDWHQGSGEMAYEFGGLYVGRLATGESENAGGKDHYDDIVYKRLGYWL